MQRGGVEVLLDLADLEELLQEPLRGHLLRLRISGEPGEDGLRVLIGPVDRLVGDLDELGVLTLGLLALPVVLEVRLVPDLPRGDRSLGDVRVRAPVRAVTSVALDARLDEVTPGLLCLPRAQRRLGAIASDPARSVVQEREDPYV